jgi:hypothetical protein
VLNLAAKERRERKDEDEGWETELWISSSNFCALCVLSRLEKHIAAINLAAKERRERKDEDEDEKRNYGFLNPFFALFAFFRG